MSDTMIAAFNHQIGWCTKLGSPFTADLLRLLKDDLASGGITAALLDGWPGDPIADAVAIRLLGALHALALNGMEPGLAGLYPPSPPAPPEQLRSAVLQVLASQRSFVSHFFTFPPQTNEVGRAAILLGGFLTVAAETGLPLRLLEIGASAGLNGQWDRFGYVIGDACWGDPDSPVQLRPAWQGGTPPLKTPVRIVGRAACDAAPIDVRDAAQALRLRAYVWADQIARLHRLDAAIDLARRHPLPVAAEPAEIWVHRRLQEPAGECATVLYHSVMWQYMPADAQQRVRVAIEQAGAAATRAAPFAWLCFEPPPDGGTMELTLTLWPGGETRLLARAHPHGQEIEWLA